jgi:hypothetical protein
MIGILSVFLAIVVVVVLLDLERRELVELEWNPFSDASRGARAEREGALGEALWYYDRAGQPARVLECLYRNLPDSALRAALLEAAAELLDLEKAIATLHPLATVDLGHMGHHVVNFSHEMATTLWQTAERVAVASALWGAPDSLPESALPVIDRLHEIRGTIRRVRDELASLVFFGRSQGSLELAVSRSSSLADTIHALTGGTSR